MLVQKPALRLYFLPFSQRNVLSFGGFFKVRMGERSVRIREVKGSNPSRSTFSSSVILTLLLFFCVHISQTLALGPGGIRTARPCRRQDKQAVREDLRIFPDGFFHRRRRRCFCRIHPRASCRVVWKYSLGVMPYSFLKARKKWL